MPIVSFETLDDAANPNIQKPGANAKKPCHQEPPDASSPEKERQNIASNRYRVTRITLFSQKDMRFALITLLCVFQLTPLTAEDADYPSDEDLAKHASEAADTIKGVIGDDWTLSVKERTITIESKFDIFRVHMISRPNLPPPLDAPTERLREEATAEKYIIRLRFERPLEREELIRRREERQKHADVLNFGASSKTAWSDAAAAYGKMQVPRYLQGFYHIYLEVLESPGRQVYPLSALKKIGAAKQIVDTIFKPMRTGND